MVPERPPLCKSGLGWEWDQLGPTHVALRAGLFIEKLGSAQLIYNYVLHEMVDSRSNHHWPACV